MIIYENIKLTHDFNFFFMIKKNTQTQKEK